MITLLTIGQTPREDLMYPFLMEEFKYPLSLKGALDEFTEKEIENLEKQEVNGPLFVRTRFGAANLGHESIEKELQKLIFNFEKHSEAIVILCTSEFNFQSNDTEIILPVLEMKHKMKNVNSTKIILIFIPIKEQYEQALEKWSEIGGEKILKVIQPGHKDTFQQMIKVINELKPEYVLLDCYGYDSDLPGEIQRKCGCIAYGPQQLAIERLKKMV